MPLWNFNGDGLLKAYTRPAPAQGALVGAGVLLASVTIAYASLKLHDEPIQRWLADRLTRRPLVSSS